MEKVIAVVVSNNHQIELQQCIEALRAQTYPLNAIVVVNNGSTDYTSVWLDQQTDIVHLYQDNLGSAGGFNTGISGAYQNGFDWIWCMEGDGYPKDDALEVMLKNEGMEIAILNSIIVNKYDKSSLARKTKKYSKLEDIKEESLNNISCSFNGTLIHRNIIAKVGLPLSELYDRGVEEEYFTRITKKYQIKATTFSKSIHYHKKLNSFHKQEWDLKTSWNLYYYLRNKYSCYKMKYSNLPLAFIAYSMFILLFIAEILLFQKNDKLRKISFAFWPMFDAMNNNYLVTPRFISKKLNDQYVNSFSRLISRPIRNYFCIIFVPSLKETSTPLTS
jgi:GT2 family glycosyltransferase